MSSDPAAHQFDVSDRERAAFEVGIKLGAAFHQFMGVPVSRDSAAAVERAIRACVETQPFVAGAKARIDLARLKSKEHAYDYGGLAPEMLELDVRVVYGTATALASIRYDEELDYPLMRIEFED